MNIPNVCYIQGIIKTLLSINEAIVNGIITEFSIQIMLFFDINYRMVKSSKHQSKLSQYLETSSLM